jgi:hypothetical protein
VKSFSPLLTGPCSQNNPLGYVKLIAIAPNGLFVIDKPSIHGSFCNLKNLLANGTVVLLKQYASTIHGMAARSWNIYFSYQNQIFYRLFNGTETVIAGLPTSFYGENAPVQRALYDHPTSLSFSSNSTLFIADSYNGRIRKVDRKTSIISTFVANIVVNAIVVSPRTGDIFVAMNTNWLYRYFPNGSCILVSTSPMYNGLAADKQGNIFAASRSSKYVYKFIAPQLSRVTWAGNGLNLNPDDNVLASSTS